jgi:large subunit ribosomal protein L18
MNRLEKIKQGESRRKNRVRSVVTGTPERPRLAVAISNNHVRAQIIDDSRGHTLVAATTTGQKLANKTMTEKAIWIGTELAKKSKAAKVKKVAMDRKGRLYHGRVKALADAARAEGLEF